MQMLPTIAVAEICVFEYLEDCLFTSKGTLGTESSWNCASPHSWLRTWFALIGSASSNWNACTTRAQVISPTAGAAFELRLGRRLYALCAADESWQINSYIARSHNCA